VDCWIYNSGNWVAYKDAQGGWDVEGEVWKGVGSVGFAGTVLDRARSILMKGT
jgi:hypothetical protein